MMERNSKRQCNACRKTVKQGAEKIFHSVCQWVTACGNQHPWKCPMAIFRQELISRFACDEHYIKCTEKGKETPWANSAFYWPLDFGDRRKILKPLAIGKIQFILCISTVGMQTHLQRAAVVLVSFNPSQSSKREDLVGALHFPLWVSWCY